MIALICNVEISFTVYLYVCRLIYPGLYGRTTVTTKSCYAITSHRGDYASGIHLPNTIISAVPKVNVPLGIHRHSTRAVKQGVSGWTTVTAIPTLSSYTGHPSKDAVLIHLPNAVTF